MQLTPDRLFADHSRPALRVRRCVLCRLPGKAQFSEQEPGPRGSPQDPQASGTSAAAAPFPLLTAKTESCFSSLSLSQEGQRGASSLELRTSDSKRLSHSKQAYSKIGMSRL